MAKLLTVKINSCIECCYFKFENEKTPNPGKKIPIVKYYATCSKDNHRVSYSDNKKHYHAARDLFEKCPLPDSFDSDIV